MKKQILVRLKRVDSVTFVENQAVEMEALSGFEDWAGCTQEKMLKMKVDPAISMKTRD